MGADTDLKRKSLGRSRGERSRSHEQISVEDPNLKYELLDELGKSMI